MESSTPAQYALILIDLALASGAQRPALLAQTQLAKGGATASDAQWGAQWGAQLGARVRDEDFRQLVHNAQALTGDPALGLRLGARLNLSAHAVLGQAFMTCRNLSEVIQLFERYYHLLAPDLELRFDVSPERVSIVSESAAVGLPLAFGLECIAAAMRNTLSGLLADPLFPLRFEFPYPEPAHGDLYRHILGADVHFNCLQARWSFPAALLDAPLPSSNPALRELYEAECARLLADLEDAADLGTQTRRLLRKFEGQYPTMPQLAAMLNVSTRTYRRRLASEGTSYQGLLDNVRAEHATRYLREGQLPVASIAYRLGFTDPSNFRRAYRRWTGHAAIRARRSPGAQN